jgi:hypothetical protein
MTFNTDALNRTKLVIWDLDDTFWRGTLSEGGATPSLGMLSILLQLSRHGIINSIASHTTTLQSRFYWRNSTPGNISFFRKSAGPQKPIW